ncbi:MAG: hypothetical protein ACRDZW_10675 [Acidimicrobiales bacterium]
MPAQPVAVPTTETLTIRPWPDPVIDALGHDPRSAYVEAYWLGILGPSTTWLLRRLVNELEAHPTGFELSMADTARGLGLGDKGGRHSPFIRALARLVQFDVAQPQGDTVLAVRTRVPPLTRRQVLRLPAALQAQHVAMQDTDLRTPVVEQQRRRGRQLALSLLELGEDLETAERQLLSWRYHPALAQESATWAWERHRRALAAAASVPMVAAPGGDAA